MHILIYPMSVTRKGVSIHHVTDYFKKLLTEKGKIVAFNLEGKALTVGDDKRDIEEARNQIKRGEFISREALEKRAENWWEKRN